MMKQKIKFSLLMAAIAVLSTAGLQARDTLRIGSDAPNQLKIEVTDNGRFLISREGKKQMYNVPNITIPEQLFNIRIGNNNYASGDYQGIQLAQETVSHENTGTMQHISKKYSGMFNSSPFSVTWTVRYNTTNPDFLTVETAIDARNIPLTAYQTGSTQLTTTRIRLGYGFDAYVNGCDAGAAYIMPDIENRNGVVNTSGYVRELSKAQIRTLSLVAVKNNNNQGSLIGYFPMGRSFDFVRAVGPTNSYQAVDLTISQFRWGLYNPACVSQGPWDSGVAVNYDSIPAGQITTIYTGMTFTTDLMGGLNYSWKYDDWSNANDTAVQVPAGGKDINLRLRYDSYSPAGILDLAFQVDLPQGLQTMGPGAYSYTNEFNPFVAQVFPDSFRVSSAGIGPAGTKAYVTLPVHLNSYGQYWIDANSISHVSKTLPIADPAILTATTTVDFAPVSDPVGIAPGASAIVKVKLPDGVVANGDLTVSLNYDFPSGFPVILPASVTIPNGQNEGEFTVTALSTALDETILKINLTGTNSEYVTCNNTVIRFKIGRKRYIIPVNPNNN